MSKQVCPEDHAADAVWPNMKDWTQLLGLLRLLPLLMNVKLQIYTLVNPPLGSV